MSSVLGRIFLYCKGADNMIFERLGRQHEDAHVLHETNRALAAYSRLGLRTLCFSKRELTREQHVQWAKVYKEASEAMYDRGAKVYREACLVHMVLMVGIAGGSGRGD